MNTVVSDPDFTLYNGDVREVLAMLPDESVDCVVTSPPYWGLRDYGTGQWKGGDPECDHRHDTEHQKQGASSQRAGRANAESQRNENFRDVCGKCGAIRVDRQIGLESSPDEFVAGMVAVFREVRRVLAPHGTCWVNLGDSYGGERTTGRNDTDRETPGGRGGSFRDSTRTKIARLKPKDLVGIPWRVAFALQQDGWYLRADIIWSKPNPMPESVTDRPTKAHEYVFLLSKRPRYWFDQEAVREKYEDGWKGRLDGGTGSNGRIGGPGGFKAKGPDGRHRTAVVGKDGSIQHRDGERWPNSGRNIRSVWEIATQPYPEAHFATYPEKLVERCLLAGCPPGGTVLDPFMGSGTTALVARRLGRKSIGVELNAEYCELAARRLQQQSLFA